MPRIRTIKPQHHSDKKLPEISLQAHLLWVLNWCYSDDAGIFENDPYLIRSNNFPRRTDIRIEQIVQWLDQLVKARFIIPFTHKGEGYYINRTFNIHQKIDKKQPSKIPTDVIRELIDDRSAIGRDQSALYSIVEDSKVKVEEVLAPSAPTEPQNDFLETEEKGKKARKPAVKFIPPTFQQAENFFIQTIGDSKQPNSWPIDKCRNEAQSFVDHYVANGWVQGSRGKPIKDWESAARNWIRNELKGVYSNRKTDYSPPRDSPPKPAAVPAIEKKEPVLPKVATEINYLFGRYLEEGITIISCEVMHYDFLKKTGMISFTDQQVTAIKQSAIAHLEEKQFTKDDANIKKFMKLFGVLEFFKQLKSQAKETVYDGKGQGNNGDAV